MVRTAGQYLFILAVILILNFAIPRAMPGDPTDCLTGTVEDLPFEIDRETRERLLEYHGLDKPILSQFGIYLVNVVRFDLGYAIYYKRSVSSLLLERLPWTLLLAGAAFILGNFLAIFLGVSAASRRGTGTDSLMTSSVLILRSVPGFLLGMLAIIFLAVKIPLFPLGGAKTSFGQYPHFISAALDIIHHLILPATVLALEQMAGVFLLMRNSMVLTLGETYMLVARAKGLPESRIRYRYGMRNAILPVFTRLGVHIGFLVTGAIFIETIFNYPGMGRLTFEAVMVHDYPVIQGIFFITTLSILTANLLVDVFYRYVDPRIRMNE